jgi:Predicted pPIWI-associating nuclease
MSLHDDFEESKRIASELQQLHVGAAEAYGETKNQLIVIQPFWEELEKKAGSGSDYFEVFESGRANLAALTSTLRNAAEIYKPQLPVAVTAAISADYLASNTVSACIILQKIGFEPVGYDPKTVPAPDYRNRKDLGVKLGKLDSTLGKTCDQIYQSLYVSTADPERAAMLMARQAWDHLFGKLAPDIEVRDSQYWSVIDPAKPHLVTRPQRILYAAYTHVRDEKKRNLILASSKAMLALYDELQRAHTRGELDRSKATNDLATIYAWLVLWADALDL